jgi:hypothetical protein
VVKIKIHAFLFFGKKYEKEKKREYRRKRNNEVRRKITWKLKYICKKENKSKMKNSSLERNVGAKFGCTWLGGGGFLYDWRRM